MFKPKLLIALMLPLTVALSGCGGSDGDDVRITNNFGDDGGDGGNGGNPNPPPGGDCDDVVEASFVSFNGDCSVGTLSGLIDQDYTLSSGLQWRIDGTVTVGTGNITETNSQEDVDAVRAAGSTLTIEPGTDIRAFDDGFLLVTRGSMIMAEGTASDPITFSSVDDDFNGLGEWGGVVVQGFAPRYDVGGVPCFEGNGLTCNVAGEGGPDIGIFGGNFPDDNSGVIKYVRIAEGGLNAGPGNEVNGLTLQGVGYDTMVEFVQVHDNRDDGIEWFGGTVNARYVVLTGNDDDDLDYDEGYKGNIQYALIEKSQSRAAPLGDNDPRAIEANSSNDDYVPETEAVLANVTIVGGPVNNNSDAQEGRQPGMRLRGAVTTTIYNSSVADFDRGCVRIDDADINEDGSEIVPSVIGLINVLADCEDGLYDTEDNPDPGQKRVPADLEDNVQAMSLSYSNTYAIQEGAAQLGSATSIEAINNGSGFVFDQTDYIGAVDPNGEAWWQGWTIPGSVTVAGAGGPGEVVPADFVSCNGDNSVCTLSGLVDQDYTLLSGVQWRINGTVTVGTGNITETNSQADVDAVRAAGVTLTIQPGTDIRAFDDGFLLVTRGSKLMANGSAGAPITFSSVDDDFNGLGEWGGVVVQGFAPRYDVGGVPCFEGNNITCNVAGEGGPDIGIFGGNFPDDDSGVIRYVRIAEGGLNAGPGNEVNGLTLQGVGYNTMVEYVQVHDNRDDGIEWFGGTVNARYVVLTGNDDDDLDYDEGYKGNVQYAIIRKSQTRDAPLGDNDPRAIEANSSNDDYVPETEAVLANITIIGGPVNNNSDAQEGRQPGMRLRGAVTTHIFNTAVADFDRGCIRIDDADINEDGSEIVPSVIELTNVIGECEDGFYDTEESPDPGQKRVPADLEDNAGEGAIDIDAAYALTNPEASVGNTNIPALDNGSGFSFDSTSYIGAVEPGTPAGSAWWAGWIIEGSLD